MQLGGGQVDPATGDFVFGVTEAYLIEKGEITRPIRAAQLIGNGPEVLRMVAKGLSYRQIAERLVLSHRTVQNHVQNTLRKLQMHNRVELTPYAI